MAKPTLNTEYLDLLLGNDSWNESDVSTANSALTVTKTAASDKAHGIYAVIVDYSDAAADREAVIKFGTTEQFRYNVKDKRILNFPIPLRAAENEAISIELPAGGAGVTSRATLIGTTIDI